MTVEESIRAQEAQGGFEGDFLAGLLEGVGDQPDAGEIERAAAPTLFSSTKAFAREALASAVPGLHVDDDGEMLAFTPPDDLIQRLDVLPASYLREHKIAERMKVTFNRDLAHRKLVEARQSKKTLWPEIAYLSDLHPLIEWLTDKVLIRVVRQQAPVIIANVAEPVFLIQGVYSNALGQPTVVQWMAISGLPDAPRIEDMTTALSAAGVGPQMVNTGKFGGINALASLIPAAIKAARAHLEQQRQAYDAQVERPDQHLPGPARHLGAAQPHRRHQPEARADQRHRPRAVSGDRVVPHGGRAAAAHPRRAGAGGDRCTGRGQVTYDSITNRGDYLSPYYLAEKLPAAIKEKGGLRARWAERDKAAALDETAAPTPVRALRALRRDYFDARIVLSDEAEDADLKSKTIAELNDSLLIALGFRAADPATVLTAERAGESHEIPVAYAGQNVVALSCAWATDSDAAMDTEAGGRLLDPVAFGTSEVIETGAKLARWLFAAQFASTGESARYVLLVHGGVVVLADRLTWGEGRYLAVNLDVALERGDAAELEMVAALFSADALQPPAEGGAEAARAVR